MIIKIAEYKIKEGELDVVLEAIRQFIRDIHNNEPQTFYEAYRRADTLEFVHLMKFQDKKAEENHSGSSYTKQFVEVLYPRCEVEPRFTDISHV